jgi:hypothetical protein
MFRSCPEFQVYFPESLEGCGNNEGDLQRDYNIE